MIDVGTVGEEVASDKPCRGCGYNLKTLRRDARCPECGLAVEYSLRGDLLRDANPYWLETVMGGTAFSAIGIPFLLFGTMASFRSRTTQPTGSLGFLMLGGMILSLIGSWLLTTPEPRILLNEKANRLPLFIRAAAMIGAIDATIRSINPSSDPLMQLVEALAKTSVAIGFALQFIYLKKLARRVPNPGLVNYSTVLLLGVPSSYFLWFITTMLRWNSGYMRLHAPPRIMTKLADVWRLGMVYFLIELVAYFVFMLLLWKNVVAQAAVARQSLKTQVAS